MITRLAPDVGFGLQHRANIGDHKYINKKSVEVKNIHLQALELSEVGTQSALGSQTAIIGFIGFNICSVCCEVG